MIIDFHTHIFPPDIKLNREKYVAEDPCFAALYDSPKAKIATAEDIIQAMDEDGIDHAVVLNYGWNTAELCARTNEYIIESIARYPDRLTGFCTIHPGDKETALKELERCAQSGIRGVGELRPDGYFNLEDTDFIEPFVEMVSRYNLIISAHASEPVGHLYPGKGTATPDRLYPFISRFPDITMVLAHWGGGLPFYALMPEVKENLRNVYFDTAATLFLYRPQIYRTVAELVEANKILFGSDYPLIRHRQYLREIESLALPQDIKEGILGANARQLLAL